MFGGSSKRTTNTYDNSINLQNGGTVVGGDMTVTDHGAIEAAFGFGEEALFANNKVTQGALNLGSDAINANTSLTRDALSFGAQNLNSAFGFGEEALFYNDRSTSKAIDSVNSNSQTMMEFADKHGNRLAQTSAGAISTLKNFAENIKVGAASEINSTQKMMLYSVIGLVGFMALFMMFKGRK
ncbi:MAG: hypothetical protein IBX55_15925 [Methyloprofundus sp.]|nr:hypothetical protein [Methyloprofundus sp.]